MFACGVIDVAGSRVSLGFTDATFFMSAAPKLEAEGALPSDHISHGITFF